MKPIFDIQEFNRRIEEDKRRRHAIDEINDEIGKIEKLLEEKQNQRSKMNNDRWAISSAAQYANTYIFDLDEYLKAGEKDE